MFKSLLTGILFCLLICSKVQSQPSVESVLSAYSYHPPSADKESWQRLNLWLSSGYVSMTRMNNPDSALIYTSRSLGLGSLIVIGEGIDDPALIAQSEWFDKRDPQKGIQLLSQTTGKKHLQLLILLGSYYAFKPRCWKYKDSVEYFLSKAISGSKTLNEKKLGRQALCVLGKMYVNSTDLVHGDSVFNQLSKECNAEGDKAMLAKASAYRGIYTAYPKSSFVNGMEPLVHEKISYLEKAKDMYRELKDTVGQVNVLTQAGYYSLFISEFANGYKFFIEALRLENLMGYPYTHYTAENIALATTAQGKFGEPLKYSLESVRAAERSRDSIGLGLFYSRLGMLYMTEGERDEEALKWMMKAIDRFVVTNDAVVHQNLFNVAEVMTARLGRAKEALDLVLSISKKVPAEDSYNLLIQKLTLATCYAAAKHYKLAEQYILTADSIQIASEQGDINSAYPRTMINSSFGDLYFKMGEFTKAKKYLDLYVANLTRAEILESGMTVYKQLIHIDSIFHDAPSAVKHYKQYVELLDSNFRASKVRQAEELQVMYQTKEKEDQIVLLNQQAKLEQASLKEAKLVRNVTIGGIVLIAIIAVLLYKQNTLKQKTNNVITGKNVQLQHLVTEKEWLLKEIHHRVKNNFQTVMGLLGTQSGYLKNDVAINAITDSQQRIHAMSLIHQRLYQTDNLTTISMPDYIHELVDSLRDSFTVSNHIRFNLDVERIELDLAHCIPLGLILNEAITNSFKYAFPSNREGMVSISFSRIADNRLLLSIKDNGAGLPPGFNVMKQDSMGMNLMRGLSEELDAKFSIDSRDGTQIAIIFVYDPTPDIQNVSIKTQPAYSV